MGPSEKIIKWVHPENADIGDISHLGDIRWVQDVKNPGKLTGIQKISVSVPKEDDVQEIFEYEIKIYNITDSKKSKNKALKRIERQLKKMASLAVLYGANDVKKIVYKKGVYSKKWEKESSDPKIKPIAVTDVKKLSRERIEKIQNKENKDENWKNNKLYHLNLASIVEEYVRFGVDESNTTENTESSSEVVHSKSETSRSAPISENKYNSDHDSSNDLDDETSSTPVITDTEQLSTSSTYSLESSYTLESSYYEVSESNNSVSELAEENSSENSDDINSSFSTSEDSSFDGSSTSSTYFYESSSSFDVSESESSVLESSENDPIILSGKGTKTLPKPKELNNIDDAVQYAMSIQNVCNKAKNIKDFVIRQSDLNNILDAKNLFENEPELNPVQQSLLKTLVQLISDGSSEENYTVSESQDSSIDSDDNNSSISSSYSVESTSIDVSESNNSVSELSEDNLIILNSKGTKILPRPKKLNTIEDAVQYISSIMDVCPTPKDIKDFMITERDLKNILTAKNIFDNHSELNALERSAQKTLSQLANEIAKLPKVNNNDESSENIEFSSSEDSDSSENSSSYLLEIEQNYNAGTSESNNESREVKNESSEEIVINEPAESKKEEPLKEIVENINIEKPLRASPIHTLDAESVEVIHRIANNIEGPLERRFRIHERSIEILKNGSESAKKIVIKNYSNIIKDQKKFNSLKEVVKSQIALNHHEEKLVEVIKEMIDVGYTLYNIYKIKNAKTLIEFSVNKLLELNRIENKSTLTNRNGRNSAKSALVLLRDKGFIHKVGNAWKPILSYNKVKENSKKESYARLVISPPFQYDFITNLPGLVEKERRYQQKRKKAEINE